MGKRHRKSFGGAVKQSLFAAEEREDRIDKMGDPLLAIEQTIDFGAIAARVDEVAPRPSRAKGGRPPFPTDVMVRVLTLKHLYAIADEALEYQLLDRLSFQRFCGLTDSSSIPDRTTVWTFEQRLREAGAEEVVFDEVQRQINASGYIARRGEIVDATLVSAPRQSLTREEKAIRDEGATPAHWSPEQRRQKDLDARWTKKHSTSHHGYKLSINEDNRCKLIRRVHVSTASEGDSLHFEGVLDPGNTGRDVYADKGYASAKREASLRERGFRPQIQRKEPPLGVLSMKEQDRNQRIAKTRARVEHVFGGMGQMGAQVLKTIGLGRARFQLTLRCAVYNMRRVTQLEAAGVRPF